MADQNDVEQELERRAMASQAQPRKGFGQVTHKQLRLVKYDPDQRGFVDAAKDDPNGQIEILIGVKAFKKDGTTYDAERKAIDTAFGTNNWRDITLSSLKALGTSLSDLVGRWVAFEFRQTKKYNKQTRQVEETGFDTFYFTQIFRDREACEAAYTESLLSSNSSAEDDSASESTEAPTADTSAIDKAAVTLFNMIKASNPEGYEEKFRTEVARNPLMMGRFGSADKALEFVNTPF